MDKGGFYVQFSPFKEAFYIVQHTLRSKYDVERVDKMSFVVYLILSALRSLVEFLQMLSVVSVDESMFDCGNWLSCTLYYISRPLNALVNISEVTGYIVEYGVFIFLVPFLSFLIFAAVNVRSRDVNAAVMRTIAAFVHLLCSVYLIDVLLVGFRATLCAVGAEHDDPVFLVHALAMDTSSCAGHSVAGVFILLCALPLSLITSALLSPSLDFRRLVGRMASVRAEFLYSCGKWLITICASALLAVEDRLTSNNGYSDRRAELRVAYYLVVSIVLALCGGYILMQAPFFKALDNRLRAVFVGALLGVGVTNFVDAIYLVTADEFVPGGEVPVGIENLGLVRAVVGAIVGAIFAGLAEARKNSLGRLLQKDINLLSGSFDSTYAAQLLLVVRAGGSMEELDTIAKGLPVGPPVDAASKLPSEKDRMQTAHEVARMMSTFPVKEQSLSNYGGMAASPTPSMAPQFNFHPPEHQTSMASVLPTGTAPNTSIRHAASHRALSPLDSPASRPRPKQPALLDQPHAIVPPAPSHSSFRTIPDADTLAAPLAPTSPTTTGDSVVCQVHLERARERLAHYQQSQTFNDLRKALFLAGDAELILRNLAVEWQDLALPQRDIARSAVLQLLAALCVENCQQAGQTGGMGLPPMFFLAFAGLALTEWRDLEVAGEAVRLASECSGGLAFDEGYLCFLLQKATEDLRNNSANAKRASGVSDMAAFRRWTTAARSLHEKSLQSLKRFFKSASQSSHWSRVTSQESERRLNPSELKAISDSRKALDDALETLRQTEVAYDDLLLRYPAVPQVATVASGFKRQFFREHTNNLSKNAERSARAAGVRNSQSQNNAMASILELPSPNQQSSFMLTKLASEPGTDKDDGISASAGGLPDGSGNGDSNSHTSLGSGLADTPKQVMLGHVKDTVSQSFSRARLWSLLSLLLIVIISSVLLIVAIMEVDKVNTWLEMFVVINRVFSIIPESCVNVVRPVSGTYRMGTAFFNPIQKYITTERFVEDIISRGQEHSSAANVLLDREICTKILSLQPAASHCRIAYQDGHIVALYLDGEGRIADDPTIDKTIFMNPPPALERLYLWYTQPYKSALKGETRVGSKGFYNDYTFDAKGDLKTKFTSKPFAYALKDATGSALTNPPPQGVLSVMGSSDLNDMYVIEFMSRVPKVIASMQDAANTLEVRARELSITPVINAMNGAFFNIRTYYSDGTNDARPFTFSEGVAHVTSLLAQFSELVSFNWDSDVIQTSPLRYSFMEFCSSSNVLNSEAILRLYREHLSSTVKRSQMIILICAVAAVIVAACGAALTIRLVRSFLKEFDRSDGVTPALAIIAAMPKAELRKMGKAMNSLRADRGIFNPDDEHAAFMDLLVPVKTQRFQDALLRARQVIHERDMDLEFPVRAVASEVEAQQEEEEEVLATHFTPLHGVGVPVQEAASAFPFTLQSAASSSGSRDVEGDSDDNEDEEEYEEDEDDQDDFNHQGDGDDEAAVNFPSTAMISRVPSSMSHLGMEDIVESPSSLGNQKRALQTSTSKTISSIGAPASDRSLEKTSKKGKKAVAPLTGLPQNTSPISEGQSSVDKRIAFSKQPPAVKRTPPPPVQTQKPAAGSTKGSKRVPSKHEDHMHAVIDMAPVEQHSMSAPAKFEAIHRQPSHTDSTMEAQRRNSTSALKKHLTDDENASVHSGKKSNMSSSSRGTISSAAKLSNALFKRPISRGFLGSWAVIMIYVAAALITCVLSVGRYSYYYRNIGDLMASSFSLSISCLFAVHMRRGDMYSSFATTPFKQFVTWATEHKTIARTKFFSVVDANSLSGGRPVGRSNAQRSALLYSPSCLSLPTMGCNRSRDRDEFTGYDDMEYMQQGLVRSIVYWTDYLEEMRVKYGSPTVIESDANDPETWFLFDALSNDLEPGMRLLRDDVRASSRKRVDADKKKQMLLLVGCVIVGVLNAMFMEWTVRKHVSMLRTSLLLLRLIPSRMLEDYRVVEKVLNVRDEEDME